MFRKSLLIGILSSSLLFPLFVNAQENNSESPNLITVEGEGILQTKPYKLNCPCQINWEIIPSDISLFQASLEPTSESKSTIFFSYTTSHGPSHGSYYVPASESGEYMINTTGTSKFKITIQQNQNAKDDTSSNESKETPKLDSDDNINYLLKWAQQIDDICKSVIVDSDLNDKTCALRDEYRSYLKTKGWCWGKPGDFVYQEKWEHCQN
ncbi:hypothetical protein [Commensalibacter melissae]|uniref:hypothetical protein n=1 Tax=Commensalibacter melissae TaxID=2070537 RepID=UPI0012D9967D|nr:hypothetical protein [Commensalibacter melissae]MUH05452.1 hypothetical protein [Commensalibacter melissae]